MLSDKERGVIQRHFKKNPKDGERVPQGPGYASVYYSTTGRLWVHNDDARRQAVQELYFYASWGRTGALTCSHPVKLWDVGRRLTARETARLQGFPESFQLPHTRFVRLFGNAVAVPCAKYACSRVLDGSERTHVDLCAGIGGFTLAARLRCVGFSEVFPAAIECYTRNFPNVPQLGDATTATYPRCDLLTAGFPCQPFSGNNSRSRRTGHHAIDFYKLVLRAVRDTRCTRLVFENVPKLLTVGASRWQRLRTSLEELGFQLEVAILDAADFGLPQHRPRLFIVGRKGDRPKPFRAPSRPSATLKDVMTP
jgi:site-specific DNA-cytosine methylase